MICPHETEPPHPVEEVRHRHGPLIHAHHAGNVPHRHTPQPWDIAGFRPDPTQRAGEQHTSWPI